MAHISGEKTENQSDLHENLILNVSVDKDVSTNFRKPSAFGPDSTRRRSASVRLFQTFRTLTFSYPSVSYAGLFNPDHNLDSNPSSNPKLYH